MNERSKKKFRVVEVGKVINDYEREIPEDYKEKVVKIKIHDEFSDSLLHIEDHSHITVLMWFDRSDRDIQQVHPMADLDNPLTGVFATRSPVRPNPIAVTVCELVKIEGSTLFVKGLDALNGTPVIDIKSYTSKYEVENPAYPEWVPDRE